MELKILTAAVVLITCIHQVTSQETCRDDCRDFLPTNRCRLFLRYCDDNRRITESCQKTCGKCQSCFVPRVPFRCEQGCRDLYAPILCHVIKLMRHGCVFASRVCRATCGFCQGCRLPPPRLECTEDCADENENCEFWEEQGHCEIEGEFPHVQVICPKSCGSCRPCTTAAPSTELPPPQEGDGSGMSEQDGDMEADI